MNIRDFKNGYFVGNFAPAVFNSEHCEIAYRRYAKGTVDGGFHREKDTQIVLITKGSIDVDGKRYSKGSIIAWEPKDVINIFSPEESEVVLIKMPGTKGDVIRDDQNFETLDERYRHYLDLLNTDPSIRYSSNRCQGIDSKDVSVVIQGYADNKTKNTIKSIRKYLSNAQIILSTWENCDVSGMDPDEIVLCKDPGGVEAAAWDGESKLNNYNRQIVSSQRGLEKVKTEYAMKIRSDMLMIGDEILKYVDAYDVGKEYALFDNRLIIGELDTKREMSYSKEIIKTPFHPSDFFTFGHTSDVRKLYDNAEIISADELGNYYCKNPDVFNKCNYRYSWRFAPEQCIFLGLVRKKYPGLMFDDWTDWTDDVNQLSENLMMSNFTILNLFQHRLVCQKYETWSFSNSGAGYCDRGLMTNNEMMEYISRGQYCE